MDRVSTLIVSGRQESFPISCFGPEPYICKVEKKTYFLSSPSLYRFPALEIARNPENVLTSTTWQH